MSYYKHKSGKKGWTPVKKKPQSERTAETGSERASQTDDQLNLAYVREVKFKLQNRQSYLRYCFRNTCQSYKTEEIVPTSSPIATRTQNKVKT